LVGKADGTQSKLQKMVYSVLDNVNLMAGIKKSSYPKPYKRFGLNPCNLDRMVYALSYLTSNTSVTLCGTDLGPPGFVRWRLEYPTFCGVLR